MLTKERNGMKHHMFTELERQELLSCKHIAHVKGSNVEYTPSFKAYALTAKKGGKLLRQIFLDAGIPKWLVSDDYAKGALRRWQRQSEQGGEVKVGRPKLSNGKSLEEMTPEELRAKVRYLEAVVEFQKQIRAL